MTVRRRESSSKKTNLQEREEGCQARQAGREGRGRGKEALSGARERGGDRRKRVLRFNGIKTAQLVLGVPIHSPDRAQRTPLEDDGSFPAFLPGSRLSFIYLF